MISISFPHPPLLLGPHQATFPNRALLFMLEVCTVSTSVADPTPGCCRKEQEPEPELKSKLCAFFLCFLVLPYIPKNKSRSRSRLFALSRSRSRNIGCKPWPNECGNLWRKCAAYRIQVLPKYSSVKKWGVYNTVVKLTGHRFAVVLSLLRTISTQSIEYISVAEPEPEPQGAASFGRSRNRSRSRKAMRLRLRRLRLRQWYLSWLGI
jgi:hypothetical protein